MDEFEEPMDVDVFTDYIKHDESAEQTLRAKISKDLILPSLPTMPEVLDTRYENRGGTFTTGIDIFSKEEKLKMEERAKRFGLKDKLQSVIANEAEELYASMGVTEDGENSKHLRLNVIHMRGTEDMSSKDVFTYFKDYAPASIEWINDVSCNVVWLDNISAARALLGLSKKIVGASEKSEENSHVEKSNLDDKNEVSRDECLVKVVQGSGSSDEVTNEKDNTINLKDIDCPLPPGQWRKGINHAKSKGIFLRFATRADKKQPKAEKMSDYYKKYGNPNFGGVKGILTESRKRMYKETRQTKRRARESSVEGEATDVKRKKNPWGSLSQTWGIYDSMEEAPQRNPPPKDYGSGIKERLGFKCAKEDPIVISDSNTSDESDSDDEWCKRNKGLRMRMHADDEEEKLKKRRSKLQHQMKTMTDRNTDLRSRLCKGKNFSMYPEKIQVVVPNTQMMKVELVGDDKSDKEEGEIEDDDDQKEIEEQWIESEKIQIAEKEEEDEEEEEDEDGEEEEEENSEDSELSEKEIQGPKGSVIKVVPRKPRLASTVWARLNHTKSDSSDSFLKQDRSYRGKTRETFRGVDLRTRLNHQAKSRSPLRIEVKNDKYAQNSDLE
ncbi:nuclear cap-binding protein subunit 3 [Orussus abietinus]|uniref:nuclear cap-binding protein subunit 3 n=1 Tax=Orussus abietinus TaxID=222816 RepID=UPI0006263FC1|nr:nuclear cap-binding protein subunit 3 [Orussus abietinus]